MAVLSYSLLNSMRVNAARLNYYQPAVYLTIGGTRRETTTRLGSVRITKTRGPDGSQASLRVFNFTPTVGQAVIIGCGSLAQRLFGGIVQRIDDAPEENAIKFYDLSCVGYRWLLDRRLVFKTYAAQTVNAIISNLLSTYTSGFTSTHVATGLPTLASIAFDGITVGEAFDRLKALVDDSDWYVDDYQDVHFFTGTESRVQPATVTAANIDYAVGVTRQTDYAQARTRVYVRGRSVSLAAAAAVGDTSVSVEDTTPFSSTGGSAITEDAQTLTYTSLTAPSSGSVTAPSAPTSGKGYYDIAGLATISGTPSSDGASPSTITVTTAAAHGFSAGQAVVITGGDSSVSGPVLIDTVPTSASFTFKRSIVAAVLTAGGYVRACLGLTSLSVRVNVCTVTTSAAHGLVVGQAVQVLQTGTANSAYRGVQTVTSVPSTTSFTFSVSGYPADSTAFPFGSPATLHAAALAASSGSLAGTFGYKVTFAGSNAETLASSASSVTVAAVTNLNMSVAASSTVGGSMAPGTYGYGITGVTAEGETTPGTIMSFTLTGGNSAVAMSIDTSYTNDPRIRGFNIWRTANGAAQTVANLRYVGSVALDLTGSAVSFTDTVDDTSRGSPASTTNTTGGSIALSSVAVSADDRVGSRRIYRTAVGGSTYKYAATINDNVTTGYVDGAADTTLGEVEPTAAGVFAAPGTLTGIPASSAGSIASALPNGSSIAPFVQRDDVSAQTALAALEGGDGIREHHIELRDAVSVTDLQTAGDADLNRFSASLIEYRFASRDDHFEPGCTVTLNVASPSSFSDTSVAQEVTIDDLALIMRVYPLRQIRAAGTRYTLTDILRRVPLVS